MAKHDSSKFTFKRERGSYTPTRSPPNAKNETEYLVVPERSFSLARQARGARHMVTQSCTGCLQHTDLHGRRHRSRLGSQHPQPYVQNGGKSLCRPVTRVKSDKLHEALDA